MKKILYLLFISLFVFVPNVQGEDGLFDSLVTDSGLVINSYTENWTGNKLIEINDELLKNTHGIEMNYLKEINLYPHNPIGGTEEGVYNGVYKSLNLLGKKRTVLTDECTISLYNLEEKNEIIDIAKTLSHEYGHHFTLYYLIEGEGKTFDEWRDTQLYQIRQLEKYKQVTNDYSNGHHWSIIEIVAEDYIQLYGSPTAKYAIDFKDIEERYKEKSIDKAIEYQYSIYNINPQENNWIPLASEVDGLKHYWERVSGIKSNVSEYSRPQVALIRTIDLGYDKYQYVFQWSRSIDNKENEAESYTLVALDMDRKKITPIKTVSNNELLEGIVGSIRINEDNRIMYYTDSYLEDELYFQVYALHSDGGIVSSGAKEIDFTNPQVSQINSNTEYYYSRENTSDYLKVDEESLLDKLINYIIDKLIEWL